MWTLVASWAARHKGAIAKGSIAVVVIGGLASAIAVQTLRLEAAELDAREARQETESLRLSVRAAQANATRRAAEAGAMVRAEYDEAMEADADAVDRAVRRVEHVCVRDEAPAAPSDSSVPGAAEVVDEPAAATADDRGRAFAEKLAADLRVCNRELKRMEALQDWVRRNSEGLH